jgi:hypothetical protein
MYVGIRSTSNPGIWSLTLAPHHPPRHFVTPPVFSLGNVGWGDAGQRISNAIQEYYESSFFLPAYANEYLTVDLERLHIPLEKCSKFGAQNQ